MDNHGNDRQSVYELGYLLISSIPEGELNVEVDRLRKMVDEAGGSMISEEEPHRQALSYTMRRKTLGGSFEKYDQAWFGWMKFECDSAKVESLKKNAEILPNMLRLLLITTVRENTYLGKRAAAAIKENIDTEKDVVGDVAADKKETAPATIEEMDKSIDEMVKEI